MSETQDRLNWRAFRYVANDLSDAEVSEFESLLLTDQGAREAVARAVKETIQIRGALTHAGVVAAASRGSNWNLPTTRVAVVAAGSCLTLLFALCLLRSSGPTPGGFAHQMSEPVSPAQLAYAWANSREGMAELPPAISAELTDTFEVIFNAPIESEQTLIAPSWMLAAVAKMDVKAIDLDESLQE